MDASQNEHSAEQMVVLLGELREQLADFRRNLLARYRPDQVLLAVDCRNYETGSVVEVWVELAQTPDDTILWWMDLKPESGLWTIVAEVSKNDQETIRRFPMKRGLSFEQLRTAAPTALQELLATQRK